MHAKRTASILENVLERMEMRTVTSSVLAIAANITINIGPKSGWNDSAFWNDRYVLPNQICTMSHAISVTGQLPAASFHRVKRRPEKQMAARKIKKQNSLIMPCSAMITTLSERVKNARLDRFKRYQHCSCGTEAAYRGKRMSASQAKMSNASSDAAPRGR